VPEWNVPEQEPEPPLPAERPQVIDRRTGEELADAERVIDYLRELTAWRQDLYAEMDRCREWLRLELAAQGLSSLGPVGVKRETDRRWNIETLRQLPASVFARIVEQTVTNRVRWGEAKKVAAANPHYRAIIDAALEDERVTERITVAR
jgi:hypothetical protein